MVITTFTLQGEYVIFEYETSKQTHFLVAVEARERSVTALKMLHELGLLERVLAGVAAEGDHDGSSENTLEYL